MSDFVDSRYEKKVTLDLASKLTILSKIKVSNFSFYSQYPDRIINNIYFDSPALDAFFENIDGISNREKYRIRWYGDFFQNSLIPSFEVKSKNAEMGVKSIYKFLGSIDFNRDSELSVIYKELPKLLLDKPALAHKLKYLSPTLANQYKRMYFKARACDIRLTLDYEQSYSNLLGFNSRVSFPLKPSTFTLEIKYPPALNRQAQQLIDHLNISMDKNSKYINGIELHY